MLVQTRLNVLRGTAVSRLEVSKRATGHCGHLDVSQVSNRIQRPRILMDAMQQHGLSCCIDLANHRSGRASPKQGRAETGFSGPPMSMPHVGRGYRIGRHSAPRRMAKPCSPAGRRSFIVNGRCNPHMLHVAARYPPRVLRRHAERPNNDFVGKTKGEVGEVHPNLLASRAVP